MVDLPILLVEDDDCDVFLLRRAFDDAGISNPIQVAVDGQEAIEYLSGAGRFADRDLFRLPCLIILDWKMPRLNGLEVLQWLRRHSRVPPLPVILFSSSMVDRDVEQAYRAGANSFVVKPAGVKERVEFAKAVKDYWLRFHVAVRRLRG